MSRLSFSVAVLSSTVLLLLLSAIAVVAESPPCPANHRWVQSEAQIVADGCSDIGDSANEALRSENDDISPCCYMHNTCYKVCGVDKKVCDKDYRKCIKNACKMSSRLDKCEKATKPLLKQDPLTSDEHYEASQAQSCACTTAPAVISRYSKQVEDILSRSAKSDEQYERKLRDFQKSLLGAHAAVPEWRPFLKFLKDNVRGIKKAPVTNKKKGKGGDDEDL